MIIDLPANADQHVLSRAADKVGVKLAPIGQVRFVRPRDIGEQVKRIDSVRIGPADPDTFRAYSESWSDGGFGRRKNAVCWHGHRDWMRAIFAEYPATAIRSAVAVYLNKDDFEAKYRGTRDDRTSLCKCEDE